MGFLDKRYRGEIEKERQREHAIDATLARKAIAEFCDPENIATLIEKIQAKVRYAYEHGYIPIDRISVPLPVNTFEHIGRDNRACVEALMTALQSVEPATYKVNLEYSRGGGDEVAFSGIAVKFEPPLA